MLEVMNLTDELLAVILESNRRLALYDYAIRRLHQAKLEELEDGSNREAD